MMASFGLCGSKLQGACHDECPANRAFWAARRPPRFQPRTPFRPVGYRLRTGPRPPWVGRAGQLAETVVSQALGCSEEARNHRLAAGR